MPAVLTYPVCFTRLSCFAAMACLPVLAGTGVFAAPVRPLEPALRIAFAPDSPRGETSRAIESLFSEEIQQATARLKWRGETLSPDTVYAVALTGASWEPAWGREHLFSLAWGDMKKLPHAKQRAQSEAALREEVRSNFERRDWRRVVSAASANCSLDEIACDVDLKEAVGQSFLALRQPERAFPIFAAPFDPGRERAESVDINRRCREGAFEAARQAGLHKEAVAFALSLLLEPGQPDAGVNAPMLRYLEGAGVDMDRVLLGILQSPEHLRGLPVYAYAAADLLTTRATPRLLPFLLHLASTDDVYLRARALLGMGVIAYRARRGDSSAGNSRLVLAPLREYGISTSQRKMIAEEVQRAVRGDNYRLRAAACLAIGLMGNEDDVPLLQKLSADHAYTLSPANGSAKERDKTRRLLFPVRMAASAALARFGVVVEATPLDLAGKDLDRARRGGQDVSNDRRNLRRDIVSEIVISPLDAATAAPLEPPKRG